MARPEVTWETDRLIARPLGSADAQVLFEQYACDPAVSKYMTWRPHRDVEETLEFLRRCESAWVNGSAFPWSLWLKKGGEFVGLIEARMHGPAVDLGYALCRQWWSHGLMSEALRSVVQWALAQPEVYRVWAVCDVENEASARVLERVGMQCEGVLRRWLVHPNLSDAPRDCLCYSVVKPTG